MRVSGEELIKRLESKDIKLIITVNRDLSMNKPVKEVPEKPGYIGICIYKEGTSTFTSLWVMLEDGEYDYIEKYYDYDVSECYLHHEILYILGEKGDKKLKEVI